MSIRLMTLVWAHYPAGGGELLLALALADHGHDEGTRIFPGVERLAGKTRQSERAVQYQLRAMKATTWLLPVRYSGGGRGRATEYKVNPEWIKNPANFAPFRNGEKRNKKGANNGEKGCKAFAPQPSEPLQPPRRRGGGDGLTYPSSLSAAEEKRARVLVAEICLGEHQPVLDEWAEMIARGEIRKSKLGALRALLDAANEGTFTARAAAAGPTPAAARRAEELEKYGVTGPAAQHVLAARAARAKREHATK